MNVDVVADYKGDEVSVNSFLKLLTGKYAQNTVNSKKLRSDGRSNIVIYLSGHGGDGFFKFRDVEELLSSQLSAAIVEMKSQKRFQSLLLIADTCKAATLLYPNSLPPFVENVSFIASSQSNENSFGWHSVAELEVAIIDRFSLKFAEGIRTAMKRKGDRSIQSIVESLDPRFLMSHASFTTNSNKKILASSFFSGLKRKDVVSGPVYLESINDDHVSSERLNMAFVAHYKDRNVYNRYVSVYGKKSESPTYSPAKFISDSVYESYYMNFKVLLAICICLILFLKVRNVT